MGDKGFGGNLETATGTGKLLHSCLGGDFVDSSTGVLSGRVTVHLHELRKIELWLLEDLDFSDEHVLKGEDRLAASLDLKWDGLRHRDTEN